MITYQDIEAMEVNTQDVQRAVIVGGGLIGSRNGRVSALSSYSGHADHS